MQIRNIINRFRKNKKQGFTLVELVVNMAIIGIIAVMVTTLTGTTIKNFNGQKHKEDAIAVADLVRRTVEDKVKMAGAYKLETHYDGGGVDSNKYQKALDNTGKFFIYPTSKTDVQNYVSIFQMSDNKNLGQKGKLYTIDRCIDADERNLTTYKTLVDGTGEYIKVYPLIPDDFYRGFTVDVKYEYLTAVIAPEYSSTTNKISLEPLNDENGITKTLFKKDGKTFTQNTIKIYIDVYDGESVICSKTSTITFMQKSVLVDKGRNAWNELKPMICIR